MPVDERFDAATVEAASELIVAAARGDRDDFDVRLRELNDGDLHARVLVTLFALWVLSVRLRARRSVLSRVLLGVERVVSYPVRGRRSYAYTDYLRPLTVSGVSELRAAIEAGPLGPVIDPEILRLLLIDDPVRALDERIVDRHHPAFMATVFTATAAITATSFRAGRSDQVANAIAALGLLARVKGRGPRRHIFIDGVGEL